MTARGNGLRASAYAVLIELEESLGDRMLQALAARSIAAYVVPVAGPAGTTRLILHVDAEQRIRAGSVLAGLTPALAGELPGDADGPGESPAPQLGPPGTTGGSSAASLAEDAVFAELVAAFHRTPAVRSWPDAEDIPDPPLTPPAVPTPPTTVGRPPGGIDRRRPPAHRPPAGSAAGPSPERAPRPAKDPGDDDHYVPPTLPRLAPPPRAIRWALLALGIGLALLLFPTLFAFGHRTALDVAGVLCVLGATGVLFTRLHDRPTDSPDDGAVV